MKKLASALAPVPLGPWPSVALLLLRLVVGAALMQHGTKKILNPFGWMGESSTTPGIFQALAAVSEYGGGIALILGALVPLAALGIACTMVVAVYKHLITRGDPFVGGYELALVFLAISIILLAIGPGRYSVDALLKRRLSA